MPTKKRPAGVTQSQAPQTHRKPDALQPDYMFVPTDSKGKTRNDPQRRSHVMQTFFRSKSDKSGSSKNTNPSQQPPALASGKMSFRLGQHGLERRYPYWYGKKPPQEPDSHPTEAAFFDPTLQGEPLSQATEPQTHLLLSHNETRALSRLSTAPLLLFGTSRIDPFGVLPIKLSHMDEVLLDCFSHYEKWPWCPINGQSIWSPFALADELVFHTTIFCWSGAFQRRLNADSVRIWAELSPDILRHKLASIKIINTRLSNCTTAIQDETVGSVAAMTTMAVMAGDQEEAARHMNGLLTLVSMRGGFSTFVTGIQLLIQRLISWTDLIYSELFDTPLNFPPAAIWDVSWQALDRSASLGSPVGLSPADLRAAGIPHHEVIDILTATRGLCILEQEQPLRTLKESDCMQRADMFHKVENRLNVIIRAAASAKTDPWNSTVWQTVALTNLIFVHHFLRGVSVKGRQIATLAPILRNVLLRMNESMDKLAFSCPLLLWVLSVGAITSEATSLQVWFVRKLADTCKRYSVDWLEFHRQLSGFLWTGAADEERYKQLWEMIEASD